MEQKERKLTKAKQKRKEAFDSLCIEMHQKGYDEHKLTVGIWAANIWGVIIMLPFVIFFAILFMRYEGLANVDKSIGNLFLPSLLLLAVFHELIHGFCWGLFVKEHFQAISFGVMWKSLTPYCSCSSALSKRGYIIGAVMPTLILGFLLALGAIWADSMLLKYLSLAMIFGGGGDFLIILKILSHSTKGKEALYIDHPSECGLVVFERNK